MVELELPKLTVGVRFPSSAPFVKIVGTTDVEIKLNSKELSFFVFKKGCDDMLNIIKDIDNPENISDKFKLGIITSTIETIKNNHDFGHN